VNVGTIGPLGPSTMAILAEVITAIEAPLEA